MDSTMQRNLDELRKSLTILQQFKTTMYVEADGFIRELQLTCDGQGKYVRSYRLESPGSIKFEHAGHDTLAEAFAALPNWFPGAKPMPETVNVDSPSSEILALARTAWCDAFQCQPCAEYTQPDRARATIFKNFLLSKLTGGPKGIDAWNTVPHHGRAHIEWNGSQLDSANLKEARLDGLNFARANFDRAQMTNANLVKTKLEDATIRGANLTKASLSTAEASAVDFTDSCLKQAKMDRGNFSRAIFKNADLSKADLEQANLKGADLSTAIVDDAKFDDATYDEKTIVPVVFPQWFKLDWRGKGPDPFKQFIIKKLLDEGVANLDEFIFNLRFQLEDGRMDKALRILKKNKFQLFSEVSDKGVIGIVRSQTDEKLVYGCTLTSDGSYTCCTQNFKLCGGLKGAVCKHILVLIIGLAKANQLNLTEAIKWTVASLDHKTKLNKPAIAKVFLKYQGVEAGDIDWRPTETMPEDYYSY